MPDRFLLLIYSKSDGYAKAELGRSLQLSPELPAAPDPSSPSAGRVSGQHGPCVDHPCRYIALSGPASAAARVNPTCRRPILSQDFPSIGGNVLR